MNDMTSVVHCNSYNEHDVDQALDLALQQIGGLDWVQNGMRIVIKPNLVMPKHPDNAATTHPSLLAALIRKLALKGAKVIIGDSPGGPFSEVWLKAIYDGTHISQLKREGVTLNYNTRINCVPFAEGKVLKSIDVAEFIVQADAVISFAKLKTHTFMQYTGAVKNLFGVVPGTLKAEYHQRMSDPHLFANMLVDIAEFVKPKLSIIDAVVGMEGNGPTGGSPRFVGAVIASTSPHHADLAGSALIGFTAFDVPTLKCAIDRGLCPSYVKDIPGWSVQSENLKISDFKMPDTGFSQKKSFFSLGNKIVEKIFQSDPDVNIDICIGCGECKRACPPKAIKIENKAPRFDRKKCIHCFCCQELCPQTAIFLKRTKAAQFLQRTAKKSN